MVSHRGNAVVPWVQELPGTLGRRTRGLTGWLQGQGLEPGQRLGLAGPTATRLEGLLAVIWCGGVVVLDDSEITAVLGPCSRVPALRRRGGRWIPPRRLGGPSLPTRRLDVDPAVIRASGEVLTHARLVTYVGSLDPLQQLSRLLPASEPSA